ncbi:hypothetical protein HXX76_009901 [Chlamydomonas incerta]|uniref:Nuclear nucleic acid-binding protein C1D n=1 Tax=Chlamydomonas incerta TaxID=51695 RepID=A0A835VZQ7_CHLIN|nr:hypothetical protein HXX76_009901 [Chlamydomonas incerta]|eukprot:KAG2430931.1 hypothetical protein HXX76_009901 [Chlamydomonas incerta]
MAAAVAGASAAAGGASGASALELPEDVQVHLSTFRQLLGDLKAALGAAAGAVPGGGAELAGAVPEPLERARLCVALAKAVNALHHVYIRAHGRDPFAPTTAGGVSVGRQELDRIRQYDKKVNRAVSEAELRGSRAALELDVAAASRFIDAAIPELSQQQRAALKRAGQVRRGRQAANERRGLPDRKPKKARAGAAAAGKAADKAAEDDEEEEQEQQEERQGAPENDTEDAAATRAEAGTAAAADGVEDAVGATPAAARRSTRSRAGAAAAAGTATATPSKGGKGKGKGAHAGGGGEVGAAAAAEQFLATLASKG